MKIKVKANEYIYLRRVITQYIVLGLCIIPQYKNITSYETLAQNLIFPQFNFDGLRKNK